ncbi:MAG: ABC transporter ATP-binding protein [Chlamydiota bacterium]
MDKKKLLAIRELDLELNSRRILKRVSLEIYQGEAAALVGRSGSGKSMTAHAIMRFANGLCCGEIEFQGVDLLQLPEKEMRSIRGNHIAMIFQEALHALDPLMKVGKQILEALPPNQKSKERVYELMETVGIADPEKRYSQYPHEFSGGMCQRVMIAIALAGDPLLLIADEPTTALDVTIQAQIMELLKSLQKERNLAVLFITHDLGIVAGFADQVYVMDHGEIVDSGNSDYIFENSTHPFTRELVGNT